MPVAFCLLLYLCHSIYLRKYLHWFLKAQQIEQVPLLEVDVTQAHTLQAALWTTMAELSEQNDAQKVCLVLEGIGVGALRTIVDDFVVLKTQSRLMNNLPELERFAISVVGKGAGPAIVIETQERMKSADPTTESEFDELKVTASMKSFVDRLVVGQGLCPYTKSSVKVPEGLQELNILPGPIGYRYSGFSEVCHIMSAFWNCVCELISLPGESLSTVILTMPALTGSTTKADDSEPSGHDRFVAVSELISRNLCLFRGDDVLEVLHFYPNYDRDLIEPKDKPAHGHLPPTSWLRPMLRHAGHDDEAANFSNNDDIILSSNFQRRSPFPAVVITRVSYFEALAGSSNEIVDLTLDDRSMVKASGVPSYAQNVIKLAVEGPEKLQEALQSEIASGIGCQ